MQRRSAEHGTVAFATRRRCGGFSHALFLFFLVFLLMGSAFLMGMFVLPAWRVLAARSWVQTPCTILSSKLVENSRGEDVPGSRHGDIEYQYVYDDRTYTSSRYDANSNSPGSPSNEPLATAKAVAQYPAGSAAVCYVNPSDPTSAVLDRAWPEDIWFGLIPLLFVVVGAGGMYFAVRQGRDAKTTERARQQYPDKPWMWREDWAAGRVKSTRRYVLLFLWGFAIFWNWISWTLMVFALGDIVHKGDKMLYLVFLFPAVGLGLLTTAIWVTVRWWKFGDSVVEMESVPGAIGGALAGNIRIGRPAATLGEVKLKLRCVNRVASGENTTDTVLWDDEKTLPSGPGDHIPVLFAIPADASATDMSDPKHAVVWRLEAKSRAPGIGFSAQFEVPVFRVPLTPEQARMGQEARQRERADVEQYRPPRDSRIRVSAIPSGGSEFYFPAARNRGLAVALTVCLALRMARCAGKEPPA